MEDIHKLLEECAATFSETGQTEFLVDMPLPWGGTMSQLIRINPEPNAAGQHDMEVLDPVKAVFKCTD